MQEYIRKREKTRRRSELIGIAAAVVVHAVAVVFLEFNGLKYIWPPPEDKTFVIDFIEEEPPKPMKQGREPVAPKVDRTRPVEIVQKSESPVKAATSNNTAEALPDITGDVPVATPEPETPKLDPRASFPGMSKKPSQSTTPHSADTASVRFKAGKVDGNGSAGPVEGVSNAHLEGRRVVGQLQKPVYDKQEEGIVVVKIKVDINGVVQDAFPGQAGTTVNDNALWNAARKAAMNTKFSPAVKVTEGAPLQEGTITYIFKLK